LLPPAFTFMFGFGFGKPQTRGKLENGENRPAIKHNLIPIVKINWT
jgi:hypothetical protein